MLLYTCLSFCPQGVGCLSRCILGYTHLDRPPPRAGTATWADTPPLGRHPPAGQTVNAADGTHPTGIHSCFVVNSLKNTTCTHQVCGVYLYSNPEVIIFIISPLLILIYVRLPVCPCDINDTIFQNEA